MIVSAASVAAVAVLDLKTEWSSANAQDRAADRIASGAHKRSRNLGRAPGNSRRTAAHVRLGRCRSRLRARATMLDMSSLYDWGGGEDAFAALINAFYDRVEVDELLSPLFPGGVTREHRLHVIAWWCEVFGGPDPLHR